MMKTPKIIRPIDAMDQEEIENAKKKLLEVNGPNVVHEIVDYTKGNNGRVEKLLKNALLYANGITDSNSVIFDELPVYHFPVILNTTLTFKMYDLNLNLISTCKIYELILHHIFSGNLGGGESHEYNIFRKYLTIEKSTLKIEKLPKSEYQQNITNNVDERDYYFNVYDSNENEYYNDQLDMDQQDMEFWDSL